MKYRLKHTPGLNLSIILILAVVLALVLILSYNQTVEMEIIISILAIGISLSFSVSQSSLANDRMFRELFMEYNQRYDRMNNDLYRITGIIELLPEDKQMIIDYFNLCAEEYLWFKKGRIPEDIWEAWKVGIKHYKNYPLFRLVAEEETSHDVSYYQFFREVWK